MDADFWINVSKIGGALASGSLGVFGVLFSTRDENKNLTVWGKVAVSGIVVGTAIAISGAFAEAKKNEAEAIDRNEKSEKLLSQVSRSLYSINKFHISYFVTIPRNEKTKRYYDRIEAGINRYMPSLREAPMLSFKKVDDLSVIGLDHRNVPLTIEVGRKSSLYPGKNDGHMLSVVETYCPTPHLRKVPIDNIEKFSPVFGSFGDNGSDFSVICMPIEKNSLHYNINSRELEIMGVADIDENLWYSNGRIASLLDLPGSQIIFVPPGVKDYKISTIVAEHIDAANIISKDIKINKINIGLTGGHGIWIDGRHLSKGRYAYGAPVFYTVFPQNGDFGSLAK